MSTRHLYLARHGEADPFGELTAAGRRQSRLLGERLAHLPVDVVWHSPLPRARAAARELARHLPGVPVGEAAELVDHVPFVPEPAATPPAWRGFFDGYDLAEAAAGRATADALVARFGTPPARGDRDTHEVVVTHAYPIAWLVRHALDAPPGRWLGLDSANAALTVIELRPDLPPTLVTFNDLAHLPTDLRWTGFRPAPRP
ncbi:histidine phosphatase family protein [Cellulomonas fimi]|uniref:Phosphoglycerate mutase n=1 Tax=Cellulomonas fimi (strain ATCC 484 / DSM 20113 / JCM 1341 / CCUG 24087 / LMG 16345 / NBRC 15513 / NCIMB 8980 / NCTC 7547 / NRS-133) TaxID=590998 RepID=F4H7J8_CELFA|nr:histidine phosphatase family protein [Cellulomonas fimi]AEE44555.1 Phosphoglycerate mutase [Cellulomonas fimi ATCC 484]NNH06469.1 histidine phosphatase family protein [Cellulomonas fimi]VEH26608.1 bifunctional RNase H/acid phosphatase [Cellulomonas fimi]